MVLLMPANLQASEAFQPREKAVRSWVIVKGVREVLRGEAATISLIWGSAASCSWVVTGGRMADSRDWA